MSETPADRPPGGGYDGTYPGVRPRQNGLGTAALVLGVVGLVLVILILFSPVGVVLGLLAVIFGILGIMRVNRGEADNRGQAVTGLVTGALALVLGLFFAISIGTFFATNVNDFRQFGRCMENANSEPERRACGERLSRELER
jgi:membrane-bound ClpP family serine protease